MCSQTFDQLLCSCTMVSAQGILYIVLANALFVNNIPDHLKACCSFLRWDIVFIHKSKSNYLTNELLSIFYNIVLVMAINV